MPHQGSLRFMTFAPRRMNRCPWRLLFAAALTVTTLEAADWPQWRGPTADGRTADTGLPIQWDATTNIRWKTRLPGPGHSSPIIWGDHIFLTAFRDAGGLLSYFWTRGQLVVLA